MTSGVSVVMKCHLLLILILSNIFLLSSQELDVTQCENGRYLRNSWNGFYLAQFSIFEGEHARSQVVARTYTTDIERNIYVLADYENTGTITLDGYYTTPPQHTISGCTMIKYNAGKTVEWTSMFGQNAVVQCSDMIHVVKSGEESGKLYVVGYYRGIWYININGSPRTYQSRDANSMFIAELEVFSGNITSIKTYAPQSSYSGEFEPELISDEIDYDPVTSSMIIIGHFRGNLYLDGKSIVSSSDTTSPFICKFSIDSFEIDWFKAFVNSYNGQMKDIRLDHSNGNIACSGFIGGNLTLLGVSNKEMNLVSHDHLSKSFWMVLNRNGDVINAGHSQYTSSRSIGKSITLHNDYIFFSGLVDKSGVNEEYTIFVEKIHIYNGSILWSHEFENSIGESPQDLLNFVDPINGNLVQFVASDTQNSYFYLFREEIMDVSDIYWNQTIKGTVLSRADLVTHDDQLNLFITGSYSEPSIHPTIQIFPEQGSVFGLMAHFIRSCNCSQTRCSVHTCHRQFPGSEDICSGKGRCSGVDQCMCREGYTGFACQFPVCFGKSSRDPNVCSGRGECIKPDECKCNQAYSGNQCELITCFGNVGGNSSNPPCSGNGKCVRRNTCQCYNGFTGERCENNEVYNSDWPSCPTGRKYQQYNLTSNDVSTLALKSDIDTRFHNLFCMSLRRNGDLTITGAFTNPTAHVIILSNETKKFLINDGTSFPVYHTWDSEDKLVITGIYQTGSGTNVFIKRFDPIKEEVLWVKRIDATFSSTTSPVKKGNGYIIFAGYFRGQFHLDLCFASSKTNSYFVVKMDLNGFCKWIEYNNQLSYVTSLDIQRDRLFIGGSFHHIIFFGDTAKLISERNEAPEAFGAVYDISGDRPIPNWYKTFETSNVTWRDVGDTAFDTIGNILIVGCLTDENNQWGISIAKLDSQGFIRWRIYTYFGRIRKYYYDPHLVKLAAGYEDGSFFVSGYIHGTESRPILFYKDGKKLNFEIHGSHARRYYLMKLDTTGNILWFLDDEIRSTDDSFSFGAGIVVDKERLRIFSALQYDRTPELELHFRDTEIDMDIEFENTHNDTLTAIISLAEEDCDKCSEYYTENSDGGCVPCHTDMYVENGKCKYCQIIPFPWTPRLNHSNGNTYVRSASDCPWISTLIAVICFLVILFSLIFCFALSVAIYFYKYWIKAKRVRALYHTEDRIEKICEDLFNINYSDLKNMKEIHSGANGCVVFRATWKHQNVAVKAYRTSSFEDDQHFKEFEQELRILFSIRHQNIVSLFGAFFKRPLVGIVLEYVDRGSLLQVLNKCTLAWYTKLSIMCDIARGMKFLHSKDLIHRDLKSANILIDNRFRAKITDFGISRVKAGQYMTRNVGTSCYMAPEVTMGKRYSEKCDVFSFSIVMYEILSGNCKPYGDDEHMYQIEQKVASEPTYRPSVQKLNMMGLSNREDCTVIIDLMKSCWDHDPDKRPSFQQIEETIKALLDEEEETSSINSGDIHPKRMSWVVSTPVELDMVSQDAATSSSSYYSKLRD